VLKGLPPLTTLADITEVVRGGMLLNVFLRPRDRTAHVTFVQPTAAERFLIHSQRNDLYIKGKRVTPACFTAISPGSFVLGRCLLG